MPGTTSMGCGTSTSGASQIATQTILIARIIVVKQYG
jgi:hypothetical protein